MPHLEVYKTNPDNVGKVYYLRGKTFFPQDILKVFSNGKKSEIIFREKTMPQGPALPIILAGNQEDGYKSKLAVRYKNPGPQNSQGIIVPVSRQDLSDMDNLNSLLKVDHIGLRELAKEALVESLRTLYLRGELLAGEIQLSGESIKPQFSFIDLRVKARRLLHLLSFLR